MPRARRLTRTVACALLVLAAAAACTPDVVSVDAASASDRVAPSERGTLGICGDQQTAAQPGLMLTAHDVWPAVDDVGKIASDMSLDDPACRAAVAAAPEPERLSCELGFPWYPSDALPIALARLGVTRVREAEFLRVRSDRSVSGQVSEYVLTLSGSAAAHVEEAAITCDGVQAPDAQPPVYTIRGAIDGIAVAVRVGYGTAVGLTFTGAGLNDATKLALLDKAAELASRTGPTG
jgi:hypothetical protein